MGLNEAVLSGGLFVQLSKMWGIYSEPEGVEGMGGGSRIKISSF